MDRPRNTIVLHTRFVLRRKRNQDDKIEKHKARLGVCVKVERENDNDCFLPAVDYTLSKVLLCLVA